MAMSFTSFNKRRSTVQFSCLTRGRRIDLLIFMLLLSGCGKSNKDDGDQPSDPRASKPDFSLTSVQLTEECKQNRQAAQAKYLGKIIELSGTAVGRGVGISGPWVELEGTEGGQRGVMCFVTAAEVWNKVFPGQVVKLKGKLERDPLLAEDLVLVKSLILDATGSTPPTVTAVELAKGYQTDPKATLEKYGGKAMTPSKRQYRKVVILAGEIEKITPAEFGNKYYFKTEAMVPRVFCTFEAGSAKVAEQALRVGHTIKVVGKLEQPQKDEIGVSFGELFEGPN